MKTVREIIGFNIRRLRKDAGMTQEALAEKAGMSWAMLQRCETGGAWPSPETIDKFAKALEVGHSDLFADPEAPEPETEERKGLIIDIVSAALSAPTPKLKSAITLLTLGRHETKESERKA